MGYGHCRCTVNIIRICIHLKSFSLHEEKNSPTRAVASFPLTAIACFVALFMTRKYHFYPKTVQHSRTFASKIFKTLAHIHPGRDVHFFPIQEDVVKRGVEPNEFSRSHFQYNYRWNHVNDHRNYLREIQSRHSDISTFRENDLEQDLDSVSEFEGP